jgi:hypothetical protein
VKGLEEVERLKRVHRRWSIANAVFGAAPLFAGVNKMRPILTDGYGEDLLPTLLPPPLRDHYYAFVAALLGLRALSELGRRRFYKRHKPDLDL